MNATAWMLLAVAVLLGIWEAAAFLSGRLDLTLSWTLRSWGRWWGLAIMLATTALFWHVWIERD